MTDEKAPVCPISHSQEPANPRGTAPVRLPVIPIATDLDSLVRSVNIMRDILRTLTTSLTINNTYLPQAPRPPRIPGTRYYLKSSVPDWGTEGVDGPVGYVGKDPKHRTYVNRISKVVLRNNNKSNDSDFTWFYDRPLDGEGSDNSFNEDFFERVVRVHWAPTGPSGGSGPSGPSGPTGITSPPTFVVQWAGMGGPSLFGGTKEEQEATIARQAASELFYYYTDASGAGSATLNGPAGNWIGQTITIDMPAGWEWLWIFCRVYIFSSYAIYPHEFSLSAG